MEIKVITFTSKTLKYYGFIENMSKFHIDGCKYISNKHTCRRQEIITSDFSISIINGSMFVNDKKIDDTYLKDMGFCKVCIKKLSSLLSEQK